MKLLDVSIVAIVSIFLTAPAFGDLTITGGSHNQRAAIQQAYWANIPGRFHTADLIPVQLLDDKAMDKYLGIDSGGMSASKDSDDTVDGVYEDGPPLITLRANCPDDELEYTVAHEYGHYVWGTDMNAGQQREYDRIYNRQKALGRLVSDYAAYSVNEGFAEAFATYSTFPSMLKAKDALSYDFMNALQAGQAKHTTQIADAETEGTGRDK